MDFFKAAVSSAISRGPPFPYSFGDRVDVENSIWALHNGTKREDGSNCSVFAFEINDSTRSRLPLARNAVRKLRTLRHPGVVKVLDSVETDSYIYIATERVVPLGWHVKRDALNTETIKWGLWSVATTLKFINEEASSVHGNVRTSSIFTSESGEWKLAGFEVLSSTKEDEPVIYRYGSLLPDSGRYAAPEVVKGGWDTLRNQAVHVTDAWNFGTLIYEVFNNGAFSNSEQLSAPKKIPPNIAPSYKRLIAANPKARVSVSQFLELGRRQRSFFDTPLIRIAEFVESMGVKDQAERDEFLEELDRTGDQFPEDFFKMKILPELLKSVEFGGGGPKVFSVVLKIGDKLTEEQWEGTITPAVVRLFSLPDRATRVFLLENLPRMVDHLSNKVVNDKIFPDMLTGFSDVAPIVREQTVKAVLTVVPKLSDRNINGDLLKNLAKTQNDVEPGIRTNTTICLGKIARNLGQNTRNKVLTAAFGRSLRDPFIHARNAALLALAATADIFNETDCATKLLPAITPSLIDKESLVRKQAYKTLDIYLERIKSLTADYPDTVAPSSSDAAPHMSTPAESGIDGGGWAGWAISSFTKKVGSALPGGTMTQTAAPAPERPASTPLPSQPQRPKMEAPARTATTNSFPASRSSVSSTPAPEDDNAGDWGADGDDDDDADAWGSMDGDNFFDAPLRAAEQQTPAIVPKKNPPTPKSPPRTSTGGKGSQSSFGPKTFKLDRGDEDIDFEALAKGASAAKKKPLPSGLARKSMPATTTTKSVSSGSRVSSSGSARASTGGGTGAAAAGAKKLPPKMVKPPPPPPPPPKQEDDDDDADGWGDDWDG